MGLLVLSRSLSCSLPHRQSFLALLLSLSEKNGEKSFFLDISLGVCFPVGFSGGSHGQESACNAGDPGSIPGLGRSPGEGNGNPLLQYSCLENLMDRSLVAYSPWNHKELDTTE